MSTVRIVIIIIIVMVMMMMMMIMVICQIIKDIDSLSLRPTDQILTNPKAIKYKDQAVSYR